MHTAQAHITTDRAERYLDQLCGHLGQMQHIRHMPKTGHGAAGMPKVEHVQQAPGHAEVRFADGSWTLRAAADSLMLRVEADDPAALERLKDAIATRIAKIGRRDGLTVAWHDAEGAEGQEAHDEPDTGRGDGQGKTPGKRRRWQRAGWFAMIGLVVAIHLGLIGSLLGSGRWQDAAADAILALLAVKIVLVAFHTKLGRGPSSHRCARLPLRVQRAPDADA
jgi:hypothetical protein